jgi:hypothetical protein
MTDDTPARDTLLDEIRAHYATAALAVTNKDTAPCCAVPSNLNEAGIGATQYDETTSTNYPPTPCRPV